MSDSGTIRTHTDSGTIRTHTDSGTIRTHTDSGTIRTHTDSGTIRTHTDYTLYLKGEQGGKPGFERGLSVMKYWTSLLKKYSTLPPNFLISFSNHEAWGYHNELPKEGGGLVRLSKSRLYFCVQYITLLGLLKSK